MSDPNGEFGLFGALAGMIIDAGVQGVLIATGVQDEVSFSSVAISAAAGATGAGLGSVEAKNVARVGAGRLAATGATLAGETAIGVGEQALLGNDIDVGEAFVGAVVGEAAGEAVGAGSRARGRLPARIQKLALRNVTNSGETVLGSYVSQTEGYIGLARERGESYFDIGDAWGELSDAQRTAAIISFLDAISDRGDDVLLSVPKADIVPGTALAKEIEYLTGEKGYSWVGDNQLKQLEW